MSEVQPATSDQPLTRKDLATNQDVRWCPGCGDYAILATVQKLLADLQVRRENVVFVSGIGCSSRFPYYMNTYGVHTIHGRAPTIATGISVVRPDLDLWLITGDGDALSIGGNHFIHCLRRNINVRMLLFNNRIYGLTKGQYSPTSLPGHKTKSSPLGSVEQALNPISVALGAEASFIARSIDVNARHLAGVLREAADHRGTAFVEIYQNCNIFNDHAFDTLTESAVREDHMLLLEHGAPMVFGKARDRGIRLRGLTPEVVQLGDGITEGDLLVHDAHSPDPTLAWILSRMGPPHFPTPLGVFRSVQRPTYADALLAQMEEARSRRGPGDLQKLYRNTDTWIVEDEPEGAGLVGAGVNGGAGSHH